MSKRSPLAWGAAALVAGAMATAEAEPLLQRPGRDRRQPLRQRQCRPLLGRAGLGRACGPEAGRHPPPSRLGGTNLAVGGARVTGAPTDLRGQADAFLAARAGAGSILLPSTSWGGQRPAGLRAAVARRWPRPPLTASPGSSTTSPPLVPPGSWSRTCPMSATPALRAAGPGGRRRRKAAEPCLRQRARAGARGGGEPSPHPDRPARPLRPGGRVMADPAAFGFRDTTHPCAGTGLRGLPVLGPDPPHRLRPRPALWPWRWRCWGSTWLDLPPPPISACYGAASSRRTALRSATGSTGFSRSASRGSPGRSPAPSPSVSPVRISTRRASSGCRSHNER